MTDQLLNWMKTHDVPITRDAYIQLAWGSDPPDPWMPEHEAELPEELQSTEVEDQLAFDFNTNQPRDPAGTATGGRWTSGSGDPSATPAPMFMQRGNEILRGEKVVATMRTMIEGRVELTINGRRQKFRNYQAALVHLSQNTETSGLSEPDEHKMLLVTHRPSQEQFDKWLIQIQERQGEIEKAEQIGSDEDDNLHHMASALKEFRASKLEDQDNDKIGFSAVYGGPREADDTKILAVTLVRYNAAEKVARITLTGGTDRDAHVKSLQMIVANYEGKSTRIEGAAFGDNLEKILRYELAGFKMAGQTSMGMTRLIHGNPELTESEKAAKAEEAAKLETVRRETIQLRSRAAATALDFDPNLVVFSDEDKQFKIGSDDKTYNYAGSYTWGENAVKIYYPHASTNFAASATAHEIGHRKLDALRARVRDERADAHNEPGPRADPNGKYYWQKKGGHDAVFTPDGTLRAPYDKKYPFYQAWTQLAELKQDKLREDDGVSEYSKQYWDGNKHGDVPITTAYHETIAELSRLKFESGGKLQGSPVWNALFKLVDEHWAQMTPTERALKQPKSEKARW
jgi:hypothetical protein